MNRCKFIYLLIAAGLLLVLSVISASADKCDQRNKSDRKQRLRITKLDSWNRK